jgi:hypothetical protein
MPVFAADLLPDTTGRNLGNPSQRWTAYSRTRYGNVTYVRQNGALIKPGGVIFAATSPATITTTHRTLWCTIPAGLLNATGKKAHEQPCLGPIHPGGQAPQAPPRWVNPVFGVVTARPGRQAANTWRAQWELTVYAAGSAAQVDPHGAMIYQTQSGLNDGHPSIAGDTTVSGIDLTAAQTLLCYCSFSTNTSPANICVQRQLIVEVLN